MLKQDQNTQQRKATPIVLSIFSSKLLLRKLPILMPAVAMCGLLALISAFFASADSASDTYAVDSGNQITTEVDGQYYVTLTTSDVNFSVAPSKNENAAKQRVDVGVETNVAGGAKLYLAMGSNSNSLHLNGNTAQSSPVIAAVADGTDVNNFAMNTWGYSTDDQAYSAVPTAAGDPALLATVDGETVGSTSGSVISASVPVYYAAKVDTSIPAGSYSNRVTYSAVVDGGITTEATLTSIKVDGKTVENLQIEDVNVLTITTNLMTSSFGVPRVYYTTTSPTGYAECSNVVVSKNSAGYMTVTCSVTPELAATGVALHIVPKGDASDKFCSDGTYTQGSSDCEAGAWQWGSFTVTLPDIVASGPDIDQPATSWDDLEIMQHMTPEICASASKGDTKQLIDWRDGKIYWVAKLKDGNCWMTQNLDLDLASGEPLTPELSDVSSDWDPSATTFTAANQGSTGSYTVVQSWDLGEAVWKTPNSASNCSPTTNLYGSVCFSYWQNVSSGWTPMTEYRTDGVTYDTNTRTYDAHYLAGNYYSWQAATAGTALSGGGTASGSICPKGFELPLNSGDGSYSTLASAYNIGDDAAGGAAMRSAPLFFVHSGYVSPSYYLNSAGRDGHYWSSVGVSSSTAYNLTLNSDSVRPSYLENGYFGFSVRCVVPSA